jgi:hypothetical protein
VYSGGLKNQKKEGDKNQTDDALSKKKTAKLLQQFGGAPRFGKRRLHLQTV